MPFRSDRTSNTSGRWEPPALSKYGMAAVGAGIRYPVIGASGEEDGFHRIALPTVITAPGFPLVVGKRPTGDGVLTVVGKAHTKAGVIPAVVHNPQQRAPGRSSLSYALAISRCEASGFSGLASPRSLQCSWATARRGLLAWRCGITCSPKRRMVWSTSSCVAGPMAHNRIASSMPKAS